MAKSCKEGVASKKIWVGRLQVQNSAPERISKQKLPFHLILAHVGNVTVFYGARRFHQLSNSSTTNSSTPNSSTITIFDHFANHNTRNTTITKIVPTRQLDQLVN